MLTNAQIALAVVVASTAITASSAVAKPIAWPMLSGDLQHGL